MIVIAEDRSISVPPGARVHTTYVAIDDVILACKERMAIGDVNTAYQRRLQLGENQPWPPPVGYWEGTRFVIKDGRHDYVAALMLGLSHILVAWIELKK